MNDDRYWYSDLGDGTVGIFLDRKTGWELELRGRVFNSAQAIRFIEEMHSERILKSQKAHVCPRCGGTGREVDTTAAGECHPCSGTGVIWAR